MASFASSATSCGARKHAWTKKKKVGENNGQLRFVRHHVWRTQASLDQKKINLIQQNNLINLTYDHNIFNHVAM